MRGAYRITVELPNGVFVSDTGKTLLALRKQSNGAWLFVADIWNSDLPPLKE